MSILHQDTLPLKGPGVSTSSESRWNKSESGGGVGSLSQAHGDIPSAETHLLGPQSPGEGLSLTCSTYSRERKNLDWTAQPAPQLPREARRLACDPWLLVRAARHGGSRRPLRPAVVLGPRTPPAAHAGLTLPQACTVGPGQRGP